MASSGHRCNILYRKADILGTGTWIKDGVIWVTVNFEQTTPGWGWPDRRTCRSERMAAAEGGTKPRYPLTARR
jgi:hypothetical protein